MRDTMVRQKSVSPAVGEHAHTHMAHNNTQKTRTRMQLHQSIRVSPKIHDVMKIPRINSRYINYRAIGQWHTTDSRPTLIAISRLFSALLVCCSLSLFWCISAPLEFMIAHKLKNWSRKFRTWTVITFTSWKIRYFRLKFWLISVLFFSYDQS